jgi:hypothetical protein
MTLDRHIGFHGLLTQASNLPPFCREDRNYFFPDRDANDAQASMFCTWTAKWSIRPSLRKRRQVTKRAACLGELWLTINRQAR